MPDFGDNQDENRPGGSRNSGPPIRFSRGILGWIVFIGFALVLVMLLTKQMAEVPEMKLSAFLTHIQNGDVEAAVLKDDAITGKLKEPEQAGGTRDFEVKIHPSLHEYIVTQLADAGVDEFRVDTSTNVFWQVVVGFVPWLLVFGFIWFFVIRQFRQASGGAGMLGSFGRSRHRVAAKEHTHVTFADVAGIDEAKEEVTELIEFLKNPKRFQRLGGRIPRGVLLVGEPGCGKTLLAKAIAGEADVPFFSISGSDFVEMFVGVGASRVRDLFKQAKDNAPCIIFLDEIDAVGRRRGANYNGGGHDEREQTLNAILVEMDGFETNDQVIVIAATNRVDVLDPALIRPGRFDRQVFVPLPDIKGRLEILKIYAKKIKLGPDVDLHRLARGTPLFSGADLAAIINEAALLATMSNKEHVEQEDLEEARDKIRWGRAKRNRVIDEKERVATAWHEAGHAIVQALLPETDPIHKVSIIPRGPMGGATMSLPEKDRQTYSRNYLNQSARVLCAGRIAEELASNDLSTGAAADIRQVTEIARRMVTDWGMNKEVGFIYYGEEDGRVRVLDLPGGRDYSDQTAQIIDQEVKKFVDTAYQDAEKIILENRDKLAGLAEALLKYETLSGDDVGKIIRGEPLNKPALVELVDSDRTPMARPIKSSQDSPAAPTLGPGALPQPGIG
jgi:cell division protease FtsH